MAWRWPGDKPLSEPIMVTLPPTQWFIQLPVKHIWHIWVIKSHKSTKNLWHLHNNANNVHPITMILHFKGFFPRFIHSTYPIIIICNHKPRYKSGHHARHDKLQQAIFPQYGKYSCVIGHAPSLNKFGVHEFMYVRESEMGHQRPRQAYQPQLFTVYFLRDVQFTKVIYRWLSARKT